MANSPNWRKRAERDACMLLRSYFCFRFCNYSVVCGCLVALYQERFTKKNHSCIVLYSAFNEYWSKWAKKEYHWMKRKKGEWWAELAANCKWRFNSTARSSSRQRVVVSFKQILSWRELCCEFCRIWGEGNCVVNFIKPYRSAQRFIQAYFCPQDQISVNCLKLSWLGKTKMKKVRFLFLFCKPSYILRLVLVTSPSLDINK